MRVLVVEHTPRVRRNYEDIFEQLQKETGKVLGIDLEVHFERHAESARHHLKNNPVDLVILEVMVPIGGGYSIIEQLSHFDSPPFLFINSDLDSETIRFTANGRLKKIPNKVGDHKLSKLAEFKQLIADIAAPQPIPA